MSTGMLSLQNAPRTVDELKNLPRGVRYRLAMQMGVFADDSQEMAFNGATDQQQCEALASGLAQWDAARNDPNAAAKVLSPPGGAGPSSCSGHPAQPPMQQQPMPFPQMPQQQFPQPHMAPSMGMPTIPQQQPQQQVLPPRMPPQQPMAMPPDITPPGAMAPPQQAPQPQPPQMLQPQMMEPQIQPVARKPPAEEGGAALTVLRGMSESLKRIAETNEANQKWLQQLTDQSIGHAKMFEILLVVFLVFAEQQGLNPDVLAKLCAQVTDEVKNSFLQQLGGGGKG